MAQRIQLYDASSNPTLWKFLTCLRAEQSLTDARHTKRLLRERPEPRAHTWVRYDEHLQRIVDDYDDYCDKMDRRLRVN